MKCPQCGKEIDERNCRKIHLTQVETGDDSKTTENKVEIVVCSKVQCYATTLHNLSGGAIKTLFDALTKEEDELKKRATRAAAAAEQPATRTERRRHPLV